MFDLQISLKSPDNLAQIGPTLQKLFKLFHITDRNTTAVSYHFVKLLLFLLILQWNVSVVCHTDVENLHQ